MGGSGSKATNVLASGPEAARNYLTGSAMSKAPLQGLMQDYASGKIGLGDLAARKQQAVQQAAGAESFGKDGLQGYSQGDYESAYGDALTNQLAIDPLTGSRLATEQVQQNPILRQLFGEGGALSRTNKEEQELAQRGFSLKPEDHEAYGQASDNIARLFGAHGNNIAQELASRGLASAPSGAAGVAFSDLRGNKDERLAQSQMQIAQARMNMNQQRLASARNFMIQLGAQGQNAIQDQYGRNLSGVQNKQSQAKQDFERQQAVQKQENESFEQEQATKGPGVGGVLGGLAGGAVGAATGGLGGALGKGLGAGLASNILGGKKV